MELLVYDRSLMRLGVVENMISVIWARKYYEPGEFEIVAPLTQRNLDLFRVGNIVTKKDSIEAGVIEDLTTNEAYDVNQISVRGRFLSSYFDRRLIQQTFSFNGYVENAMRELIEYVNPIPLVVLGELNGFTETVTFQATMKELLSYLTKLSKASQIGFRLRPDFKEKNLVFETYKGVDRTLSQGINGRVIFSESYQNLNQMTYRYNDQLYKSKAIVGGEGEGSSRIYIEVGDGEGLDLRELFVDAKDIRSDEMTDEQYREALTQRGIDALARNFISETIECETEPNINFRYRVNYDLGDIVSINKQGWGIRFDQRITEIKEIYEGGGMMVSPTFGDPLPQAIDWEDK